MMERVDAALEAFLRRTAPFPEDAVAFVLDPPDKAWDAGVTRPTVSAFLWDVRRNADLSVGGQVQGRDVGGTLQRRRVDPYVDLRYFVTVKASDRRDEHRLLGRVLDSVLRASAFGDEDWPADGRPSSPVHLRLAGADDRKPDSFFSAVDGRLRPGVEVVVTLQAQVFDWAPSAPEVLGVQGAVVPVRAPDDVLVPTPAVRRRRSGSSAVLGPTS